MRISDWSSDVCSSDLRRHAGRQRFGGQFEGRHVEADDPAVAPAAHVEDQVAGREAIHPAFDHLADRAAGHRLIELEAGGIAFRVVHPAAHIGIDRKPAVADAELVAFERSRSEEHTSELQSLMRISYAVICLKKKKKRRRTSRSK